MHPEDIHSLLCDLGTHIRDRVIAGRDAAVAGSMSAVAGRTVADTMYAIDRVSDRALLAWFEEAWPSDEPVELVTEGLDRPRVLPAGATPRWTCIVDPIDGTRGLMYDKRAAWVLAAVAPRGDAPARLCDVVAASMTEIPTTKQWGSDQYGAVRDGGVRARRDDVRDGTSAPLVAAPSAARTLEHGWASFARFLPQGKALLARFEEELWVEVHGIDRRADLAIFDDQYLATGGQFAELLSGHDRLLGDLRPLAFRQLGLPTAMTCHPYDCCTALVLTQAGCVLTDPWGRPLDAPLDTTTPVAWIGYANAGLAALLAPAVARVLPRVFPDVAPP